MFKNSLLAAGLATAIRIQRPNKSPYRDAALAELQGGQSIADATCYPSVQNMFRSLEEALAQKG